jgi:hypothetical protein
VELTIRGLHHSRGTGQDLEEYLQSDESQQRGSDHSAEQSGSAKPLAAASMNGRDGELESGARAG